MISQLTSFDQMLPPTAPLTTAATVTQSNGNSGGATVISPVAATVIDEKQCRKRKRNSASNGTNSNNNNGGSASSSSSSASADGGGPSPKLAGVEQQLAASSPSLFLQQALRHNFVEDGMPGGRGAEQQSTGTTMDFFEAHKAFQKLSSQLSAGFTDSTASPALAQPGMNPFVQQLATLSPFLLALQHQSQFVQAQQHQFDPASLLSIPSIHNENLFHHVASSPRGYAKDEEEEEEDDEQRGHSAENAFGEPEDLSLKPEGRSDGHHNNGGNQHRNGTPSWSYEEQFKQLYELSPTDLRRKEWLDDWLEFMRRIGKPVTRIPIMAKQVLDLYELYRLVVHHGGLVEVITKKLWREIAKGLSLPTSITSAAFTLRTQYEKYLFDFECERHHFSTLADLRSAIDANKREGGRRNAPAATGAGASHGTTSNSAGATPSGHHHHQHNHHHSYSGGRHSSSNSMDSHRERHVQQQQMRWLEQMAASFGAAPPPPPPIMAAAFFGKHLLQFGTADAVPTTPTAREEDNLLNGNRTTSSNAAQLLPQFAGGDELLQFGHQNGATRQQFDSIFPKIEIATGRTSTSPQALSPHQSSSACPQRCHGTAVSSPATSSYHCPTAEHHRQSPNSPSAEKRRKPNEVPPPAASGNAPSPILVENTADGISVAPLASFGHLLKNASRCSIKMSNGGETKNAEDNAGTLSQTTTTTTVSETASSMVVSMELNGILYQGVLFAMPTAEKETERQKEC
ncbi:hypothetical protein GPALN_011427 [Globodera pallida]|nr:hypothetical protein GPALN_011427 [Globodera pallida]